MTPLLASLSDTLTEALFDNQVVEIGGQAIGLPGVRIALWLGGAISIGAGLVARREMIRAHEKGLTDMPDLPDEPEQERESA